MADNYTEFSEELQILNAEERAWLESQLELVCVYEGNEYPEDQVPPELQNQDPDYRGYRFLRDCPDVDEDTADTLGFEYELIESTESGCTLWLYSESWGSCDHVAHLAQKFLRQFRPDECWWLSYSASCSKPRIGEFGGGAVFVTAKEVRWCNTDEFLCDQRTAFENRAAAIASNGPECPVVVSVFGGCVQDVFTSEPGRPVVVLDWDTEGVEPTAPNIFAIENQFGGEELVNVWRTFTSTFPDSESSDVGKALTAARILLPAADVQSTQLTDRELASVLAALRHWQESLEDDDSLPDRFPQFDAIPPLSLPEIERLCVRLN
jgi:hypothetical protein